jgi:hypothetical protein
MSAHLPDSNLFHLPSVDFKMAPVVYLVSGASRGIGLYPAPRMSLPR